MRSNGQSLALMMESYHREQLDHNAQNDRYNFMRVLSESQVIRVETLEQDLGQLNQVVLEVLSVPVYEVSKDFQHVLLIVRPVV